MKLIDNQNITDPHINLALEEHALLTLDLSENYLLFYINEPSVIIGKHQNTDEEINTDYVEKNNVHVVRRISGGGAVYHDLENLNFSFISRADQHVFHRYETLTKPIIEALHKLGVPATLNGRNDIEVEGRKISGNAQYQRGDRMFCHGTLLLNSHLENMVKSLNVNFDKMESKGIKSVRARVANISEFLKEPLTMQAFKALLIQHIIKEKGIHSFDEENWQAIRTLSKAKYQTYEWNYGKSPKCNIQNKKRFAVGTIDVRLFIEHGKIKSIKFYGDFFAQKDIQELENLLTGISYDQGTIASTLQQTDLCHFFGHVTTEALLDLLI